MADHKAAVIIPFYKNELSAFEKIALDQCFKVLANYTIIAIKPEKLVMPPAAMVYPFNEVACFDNKYFRNIEGYNELMLSEIFYGRFLTFEYILIYQLDAFVFKDELDYWCSQDIDYVGAPWIRRRQYSTWAKGIVSVVLQHIYRRYNVKKHNGMPSKKQFDNAVGNGGFSLRRTKLFYDLCISWREKIEEYNNLPVHQYNEDVFWSLEVNRKKKSLKIPGYKKALKFSVEWHPIRAFMLNHNQLPFGCHGWEMNLDFWRPFFKESGYDI